ncbi:MAG: methionine ABC transporter permease [Cellulomonadaceae bacterium]
MFTATTDWYRLGPMLVKSIGETFQMVSIALVLGGIFGLLIGLVLYTTRAGNLFANKVVFTFVNVLVNLIRPIPFVIFITAIGPLTKLIVDTTIGTKAMYVPMVIMASFAFSRLVEQNLVSLDPGVVEAARAMGASRLRVVWSVLIPEALAPLILGYTFLFVGVVDMSALASVIGGGGLGAFAIQQGYQRLNWEVVWVALVIIIVIVQAGQLLGNFLAKKVLRR